jgi:tRNA (cytidine/uridine-2'-O-)-methyltransferase
MATLHVVLVEPEIPQNTGNIARTCAATGAWLHLVEPLGFEISDARVKRAGLDYWNMLHIVRHGSLGEFLARADGPLFCYSTKAEKNYCQIQYPMTDVYLLFGKETKGLPESLLCANRETVVRLPMRPDARSLNLSNSVAIAVYEVLRQWGFPGLLQTSPFFEEN